MLIWFFEFDFDFFPFGSRVGVAFDFVDLRFGIDFDVIFCLGFDVVFRCVVDV